MKLTGWGRYPVVETTVTAPRRETDLIEIVRSGHSIARGNGRAYGDCAVNPDTTVHMKHFNRMLSFDATAGVIVVEAGVLLADVIRICLPKGWFPPVTPGTKFVTIGGMVAADVHGKNHHKNGSFGEYVDWIDLLCWDGEVRHCSPDTNPDLFNWTIGGMGLTGIIIRVAFRMLAVETGWIRQQTRVAANIDQAIDLFEAGLDSTYSVAWIDCMTRGASLGRSIIKFGEHAGRGHIEAQTPVVPLFSQPRKSRSIIIDFPTWTLNNLSVRCFNAVYFWKGKTELADSLVSWDSFFYPLDSILGWNRIYGRRGFVQYQCVIPLEQSRAGLRALLNCIAQSGGASFLAVLKRLGTQRGNFSFPREGYTLALDFPVSDRSLHLMKCLDSIVVEYGGRLNLAKDSRLSATSLEMMDDRVDCFRHYRQKHGIDMSFFSEQSIRLQI
jgi:FAD/FMN-containing dehydrogenase